MAVRTPPRPDRLPRPTLAATVVLAVAAAAWIGTVAVHSPGEAHHGHHGVVTTSTTTVAISLAGWTLMVLAMMLPPALPLVGLLGRLLSGRGRRVSRLFTAVAAFVGVWTATGVVLITGAAALDLALGAATSTETRVRIAGGVVLLAGLYQFTPIKNACLTACRTPRWFALRLWGRHGPTRDAAAISGAYGVSCVGCCWALMLLCLGTGALALPVMVVLTIVMAAERLVPAARAVARATGLVLVLLGTVLLADLLPLGLVHPLLGA